MTSSAPAGAALAIARNEAVRVVDRERGTPGNRVARYGSIARAQVRAGCVVGISLRSSTRAIRASPQ